MPCVNLFDMPGASLSRHKPTNSWLHTDNLPISLHLYICHTNNWRHMNSQLPGSSQLNYSW
jgi:hypothetical protein